MARFADALEQARWTNKVLVCFAAAATVVAIFAILGWRAAPKELSIHIPPDLSKGATIRAGSREVPPPNVYTFAFYIWQQLNRWNKNGQQDYGDQIFRLQNYVTPACREQLIADQKIRADQGELDQRTRSIMEIPGLGFVDDRVSSLSDGSWAVTIDTQVQETSRGVPVKDAFIRYPLHIVRFDVDRDRNPWQLAVDCYTGRPERLDPKAVDIARNADGGLVRNNEAYAQKSVGDGGVDLNDLAPTGAGAASQPASAVKRELGANPATRGPGTETQTSSRAPLPAALAAPPSISPGVLPRVIN